MRPRSESLQRRNKGVRQIKVRLELTDRNKGKRPEEVIVEFTENKYGIEMRPQSETRVYREERRK